MKEKCKDLDNIVGQLKHKELLLNRIDLTDPIQFDFYVNFSLDPILHVNKFGFDFLKKKIIKLNVDSIHSQVQQKRIKWKKKVKIILVNNFLKKLENENQELNDIIQLEREIHAEKVQQLESSIKNQMKIFDEKFQVMLMNNKRNTNNTIVKRAEPIEIAQLRLNINILKEWKN
ncbi:hypothetical protein RFI_34313 [Reticulomyxa filosa]|uniref:Uncharacterized protein n=1 Tax=Reticulomyxa filosa TaxID=46433 RepID=X6LPM5_RETFI|nr:hypothetical protein RFI_34313 [Reticulomyxa filosa]|eukprot:ETO03097.1 hypothetical protein RFI_34313 [Reticulomyxa filosa]